MLREPVGEITRRLLERGHEYLTWIQANRPEIAGLSLDDFCTWCLTPDAAATAAAYRDSQQASTPQAA